MRSLFPNSDIPCVTRSLSEQLLKCGERLLCMRKEESQLQALYRKALAMETLMFAGIEQVDVFMKIITHKDVNNDICKMELHQVCPSHILE